MDKVFISVLLLLFTASDAAKDAIRESARWPYDFLPVPSLHVYFDIRHWTRLQWLWHALKWFGFYGLSLLTLVCFRFDFIEMVIVAAFGAVVWVSTYQGVKSCQQKR